MYLSKVAKIHQKLSDLFQSSVAPHHSKLIFETLYSIGMVYEKFCIVLNYSLNIRIFYAVYQTTHPLIPFTIYCVAKHTKKVHGLNQTYKNQSQF